MMKTWYFTFGYNSNLRNNYVKIQADGYYDARAIMVEHYGHNWAFQYAEDVFMKQLDEYDLVEVQLGTELIKL